MEREAMYYEKRERGKVQCFLCPHNCVIGEGKAGVCGVRRNKNERLVTMIYGEVSSIAMDPIEKKPLYHFYPGSSILSIGTVGCSFRCQFCQNYSISQNPDHPTDFYSSSELVNMAIKRNSIGIAYTYSEPLIWYEFVLDTCREAKKQGMKNVFVTNGYINQEPLEELLSYSDAFNIDLKSFNNDFYGKICGAKLNPVLKTIKKVAETEGIILEVTTLIIPGYNDTEQEIEQITDFLSSLSPDIPFHLSAYYPMYKFKAPPTPVSTLEKLKQVAEKKMRYVYLGNVAGPTNTTCPHCGSVLIERRGYHTRLLNLENGRCKKCSQLIPVMV